MRKFPINEDSYRDLNLHYTDCLVYDTQKGRYMTFHQGSDGRFALMYLHNTEHTDVTVRCTLQEFCERFQGVLVPDGYINFSGAAVLLSRKYDGSYRKCTSSARLRVSFPCQEYLRRSRHKTPHVDPLKLHRYAGQFSTMDVALAKLRGNKVASIAISPEFCIAKNGQEDPWHVLYYDNHVGYMFKTGEVVLIPEEIKELAEERGLV